MTIKGDLEFWLMSKLNVSASLAHNVVEFFFDHLSCPDTIGYLRSEGFSEQNILDYYAIIDTLKAKNLMKQTSTQKDTP
jgi:hypothetical protein